MVRSADVVWRTAHDRVIVREVFGPASADLVGLAGLVWVASEHPTAIATLASGLNVDPVEVAHAVELLVAAQWLTEASA